MQVSSGPTSQLHSSGAVCKIWPQFFSFLGHCKMASCHYYEGTVLSRGTEVGVGCAWNGFGSRASNQGLLHQGKGG